MPRSQLAERIGRSSILRTVETWVQRRAASMRLIQERRLATVLGGTKLVSNGSGLIWRRRRSRSFPASIGGRVVMASKRRWKRCPMLMLRSECPRIVGPDNTKTAMPLRKITLIAALGVATWLLLDFVSAHVGRPYAWASAL